MDRPDFQVCPLLEPDEIKFRCKVQNSRFSRDLAVALNGFFEEFRVTSSLPALEYCVRELIDNGIRCSFKDRENFKQKDSPELLKFMMEKLKDEGSQVEIRLGLQDGIYPHIEVLNRGVPSEREAERLLQRLDVKGEAQDMLDRIDFTEGAGLGVLTIQHILSENIDFDGTLLYVNEEGSERTAAVLRFAPIDDDVAEEI